MKMFTFPKLALCAALILGATSSFAGYSVHTTVETAGGKNLYTWTVYNQDQATGLDAFMMEVPVETQVLAYTVPPPYSNEGGIAHWIMGERHKEAHDPHDGRMIYPAPKPGMKWLAWWGVQPPSVYPAGTSATFTLTTDASVEPATVNGLTVTYTPQDNPHFYQPWNGSITGPGIVRAGSTIPAKTFPSFQTYSVFGNQVGKVTSTSDETVVINPSNEPDAAPEVTINLHAGITIEGIVGRTYTIHFSHDLNGTSGWETLGSYKLSAPKEIWFDPEPATQRQRFYKVMLEPLP